MCRFVLLHHTGWPGRSDHYDLMLETQSGDAADERALLTFATQNDELPAHGHILERLPAHRRAYLAYEGAVSGGRGQVARIDKGTCTWLRATEPVAVELQGAKLFGRFSFHASGGTTYRLKVTACGADRSTDPAAPV